LTKDELKKIVKLFGSSDAASVTSINLASNPSIDFLAMSKRLGLHKESFNHLGSLAKTQRA
jgi:hypothetical protein